MSPQAMMLPDGKRLHLHHGPIDLIIEANEEVRAGLYQRAEARFATVLDELVPELPVLRSRYRAGAVQGPVARRMASAVAPFSEAFVTPMAAVAGAVADEILVAMTNAKPSGLRKLYVNNGGDIACYVAPGETLRLAMLGGTLALTHDCTWRGVATSGWRGRSQSRGIADAVTVVARSAAMADAAATMIANRVDLPGHPAITRAPASELFAESDLGARLVTTDVGPLAEQERADALAHGAYYAETLHARGIIAGAALRLQNQTRLIGAAIATPLPETNNA